jgi:hypothetical protein
MNKLIRAVKDLDLGPFEQLLQSDPDWVSWAAQEGKMRCTIVCCKPWRRPSKA